MPSLPTTVCTNQTWTEYSTRGANRIRLILNTYAGSLYEVSPGYIEKCRELGAQVMLDEAREFLQIRVNSDMLSPVARLMSGQLVNNFKLTEQLVSRLTETEQQLVEIPPYSRLRTFALRSAGLAVATASAVSVACMMLGPATGGLIKPLYLESVYAVVASTGWRREQLALPQLIEPLASRLLSADSVVLVGAALTIALSTSVVFLPDAMCVFGGRKGGKYLTASLCIKTVFAVAFFFIGVEGTLQNVPLQAIARSVFEWSIMSMSMLTSWAIGKELGSIQTHRLGTLTSRAQIHAANVALMRIRERVRELCEGIGIFSPSCCRNVQVDDATFLAEAQRFGSDTAELCLTDSLLRNRERAMGNQIASPNTETPSRDSGIFGKAVAYARHD